MKWTPTYSARCSGRGCSCSCSRGRRDGFLRRRNCLLRCRNGLLNYHSTRWRHRWGSSLSISSTNAPEEEPDKQPQKQPYNERGEPYQNCPLQPYGDPPWACPSPSPPHRAIPSSVPYSHLPSYLEPPKRHPRNARDCHHALFLWAWHTVADRGYANFLELRKAEVRRMILPETRVNEPLQPFSNGVSCHLRCLATNQPLDTINTGPSMGCRRERS